MFYISHRGNLTGADPDRENSLEAISQAINKGYEVEVDIWRDNRGAFYTGHDKPVYKIDLGLVKTWIPKIWFHAKNLYALETLLSMKDIRIFWHQQDQYTLTSNGYIWTYPNEPVCNRSIIVCNDICSYPQGSISGICSDNIQLIKEKKDEN